MKCVNCGKSITRNTSVIWSNYGNPLKYCGDCVPSIDDFEDGNVNLETGKINKKRVEMRHDRSKLG